MKASDWLNAHFCCTKVSDNIDVVGHMPWIQCEDGFTFSMQVGSGMYCAPRDNNGFYYQVEIGYPSEDEPLLRPYIDGEADTHFSTVYGYVPIETVDAVIEKHGGIAHRADRWKSRDTND